MYIQGIYNSGYLVDLSLVGRHPLDGVLGQLLLPLLGVLLGDVGEGVVGLVVAAIVVVPGPIQPLEGEGGREGGRERGREAEVKEVNSVSCVTIEHYCSR